VALLVFSSGQAGQLPITGGSEILINYAAIGLCKSANSVFLMDIFICTREIVIVATDMPIIKLL